MRTNFLYLPLLLLFVFTACQRISNTTVGSDLIPPIDGVNTRDTFLTVQSRNAGIDTFGVQASEPHALGFIGNDPVFGTTQAGIGLELKPGFFPYVFEVSKDSLSLDSVVLVLNYAGYWGDSTAPLSLQASEINNTRPLRPDSLYKNVDIIPTSGVLGTATVIPNRLDDSVFTFRDTTNNQIRIRLNNSLGVRLLNTFDSSNAYKSDSAFRAAFAGIYVEGQSGNTLVNVGLLGKETKLAIYYRYRKRTDGVDTSAIRFFTFVNGTSGSANTIKRNRTGAQVAAFLNANPQHEQLFLQGSPGIFSNIRIPGLANLPNMVVHRAELQLEQLPDNNVLDGFFSPPVLFLAATNDTASLFAMSADIALGQNGVSNFANYGGIPILASTGTTSRWTYTFNLSRYVQGVVTRKDPTYDLRLIAPYNQFISFDSKGSFFVRISSAPINNAGIGRVKLAGGNHPTSPMRLRIIYSKL